MIWATRRRPRSSPPWRGGQYAWLDAGAPESAARELVFRLLTARQALEMAAEEGEHTGLIERLLEHTREPGLDAQTISGI